MYYKKIYNIALFFTSIVVFILWFNINLKTAESDVHPVIKFFLSWIFAYGFFGSCVSVIVVLLQQCTTINQIIFGQSYFGGVWVGYYIIPAGTTSQDGKIMAEEENPVIFFQIIEQNLQQISILTESYELPTEEFPKKFRCWWYPRSEVSIDSSGTLSYLYEVDGIDGIHKNSLFLGMFTSVFQKTGFWKNPCRLHGYAFNENSATKLLTEQIKVEDHTTIKVIDLKKNRENLDEDDIGRFIQMAFDFYKRRVSNCNLHEFRSENE